MAPKQKLATNDVIILEYQRELPAQLREALRPKGFPTHLLESMLEAAKYIPKLANPILIITVGSDEALQQRLISDAKQMPDLHPYPALLIGEKIEHLGEDIEKSWLTSLVLST